MKESFYILVLKFKRKKFSVSLIKKNSESAISYKAEPIATV